MTVVGDEGDGSGHVALKNLRIYSMSDIDRILGKTTRRPPIREASSLIPDHAHEFSIGGGAQASPQPQQAATPAGADDSYLPTALALVAPDTTPKASYPLNPSAVPVQPVPAAQNAPAPASAAPPSGGFIPRPAPAATHDPALSAIIGEAMQSMQPAASVAVQAANAAAAATQAMATGTGMPEPVAADAAKVCDAFRRFTK